MKGLETLPTVILRQAQDEANLSATFSLSATLSLTLRACESLIA